MGMDPNQMEQQLLQGQGQLDPMLQGQAPQPQPPMGLPQEEVDPVIATQARILDAMNVFIDLQMQDENKSRWNLDVFTRTIVDLAAAFKNLNEDESGAVPAEQQFQLEVARLQHEQMLKEADLEMKREAHQLDLQLKQQKAMLDAQLQADKHGHERQLAEQDAQIRQAQAQHQADLQAANATLAAQKQSKELEIKERQSQQQKPAE